MRQFLPQTASPKIEKITGLSPCIALEQKGHNINPRSTVGTLTETYDLLRLLYAHLGTPYCPKTHEEIKTISKEYVVDRILSLPYQEKIHVLAPIVIKDKKHCTKIIEKLLKEGFLRIRLNGIYYALDEKIPFDPHKKNTFFLVVDRLMISSEIKERLFEAIALAAKIGENKITIGTEKKDLFYNLAFAVESTGNLTRPLPPRLFPLMLKRACVQNVKVSDRFTVSILQKILIF